MHNQLALALRFPIRRAAFPLALATALFAATSAAHAQFAPPPPERQVHDPSALAARRRSRGHHRFEDMECPDCGNANLCCRRPATKYNIPWVRHDFPLPFHAWSLQAAVNARWFDTRSKKLGDDYRDAVFANQPSIETLDGLRQFTEKFAQSTASPFPLPSIRKASWRPRSRPTTLSASASASNTRPLSGWSPPTAKARPSSRSSTVPSSSSSSIRPSQRPNQHP